MDSKVQLAMKASNSYQYFLLQSKSVKKNKTMFSTLNIYCLNSYLYWNQEFPVMLWSHSPHFQFFLCTKIRASTLQLSNLATIQFFRTWHSRHTNMLKYSCLVANMICLLVFMFLMFGSWMKSVQEIASDHHGKVMISKICPTATSMLSLRGYSRL
jgi:hypothetical protein